MQPFNERHAREILEPCRGIDSFITIDERGVWPKAEYDATDGTNLFRWRTARVFQGEPGVPEVADTPMLRFPFNACQLAAFMLEGVGALVSCSYGDWKNGPDPANLNAIDPDSNARTAIVQAYAARREAERIVGACPLALEAEADRARKAYQRAKQAANEREGVSDSIPGTDDSRDRRARAVASIAKQDTEMEATALAWKQGYEAWLNLMVRELLKPAPVSQVTDVDSRSVEQVPHVPTTATTTQTTATPAPVETASDGPTPLPALANWKMRVQAEAYELFLRLLASGANPTPHSLLRPMAKWCRDNEVKTDTGINPSEGYLRTWVLGGGHWAAPTMTREQAKKHVAQVAQTKVAQVAQ